MEEEKEKKESDKVNDENREEKKRKVQVRVRDQGRENTSKSKENMKKNTTNT